jgi:outer membrane protein TolC
MSHYKFIIILLLLFCLLLAPAGMIAQEKTLPLSLKDAVIKGMESNLDIAVEVLNPELADISVTSAGEKFLPRLSFGYNQERTNTPSYSWIEAAGNVSSDYNDYQASLQQLVPTGGQFSVSMYSYKYESNQKFQTINPRYGSTLRFNFTQPLLKDFGFKTSRKEIRVAQNTFSKSESDFKQQVIDTVYSIEEAYWNLVYSLEDLKAKQQSLELARDLLEKNKREVEVGMQAPIEVLTAESEVATREADILQAQARVQNSRDTLATLLNIQDGEGQILEIVPQDKPVFDERQVTMDEALAAALASRPDLKSLEFTVDNKNIDLGYAKNQLLPDLSLSASYWSPGVSGNQIVYKDNNPLTGDIINIIPGGASQALADSFNFEYNNWSVGLTLTVPTSMVFTRAQHAKAQIELKQAEADLKRQKKQAFLEIRNAVRAVQSNYKRVQAYRKARQLAEETLAAEEKKLEVGLSTNYMVLQLQRDLADAKSAELQALIEYNLSLAALEKAQGTTLDNWDISMRRFW